MTKSSAPKDSNARETTLDGKPLDALGRALRSHYDDLLRQPLPARFEALLAELDAEEKAARRRTERDRD